MKLLTRKTVTATNPVTESKPEKKEHTKSHKNELPSDEYRDLIPPTELQISDTGKLVISVKRGGELGLPKVDIRLFVDTDVYTGPTKKGVNFDLRYLTDLNSILFEVSEICEKLKLFDEFEDEEEKEDSEEE